MHPPRRRKRSSGRSAGVPSPDRMRGPIKRGAGFAFMAFRSGVGHSNAIMRVDSKAEYSVHVGVTDVGGGAKTHDGHDRGRGAGRAALADRCGVGRYRRLPVFGGRVGQPHDDHDRLRGGGGRARSETPDRRERTAEGQRCPHGVRQAEPDASRAARCATRSVRISSKWKWIPNSGRARVSSICAVHDCGRIMNPLTAISQIKGGSDHGHRHGACTRSWFTTARGQRR